MAEDPASWPAPLAAVRQASRELGLELRGALAAGPLPGDALERLDGWLAEGRADGMPWLARARPQLGDLRDWKPWAGSALLFRAIYPTHPGGFRGGGQVARYALGQDYHHLLGRRLEKLGRRLRQTGVIGRFRVVVDAAPVLEREWALQGGLGFRGKNTLVLDREAGPWQLLAELLVDTVLPVWRRAPAHGSCGSCTACLDACPTGAFTAPWSLEPRRCISYLTIEHRGPIPPELRPRMGDWVFGCDVCLEVCPFGSRAEPDPLPWGRLEALERWSLEDLLGCSESAFAAAFRGSPLRRPGWTGMLRNACVALGNLGRGEPALVAALRDAPPLVRGHAAWALGRLAATAPLRSAWASESEPEVRREIEAALRDRES